MADLPLTIALLSLVVSVAGLVPLYVDLLRRWRIERSVAFSLLRFQESSKEPVESEWGIRILHPDKEIEKCAVFYDGTSLPLWDPPNQLVYERWITRGGGANFRIPRQIEKEDVEVVVKDGARTLRKRRFNDIPKVPQ